MKDILRVFPRRTKLTPTDIMVRIGSPTMFDPPQCSEIHISVCFTWDLLTAEKLYKEWSDIHSNVKIGGPAFGSKPGEFTPGLYLENGNLITSRGCPNSCWFCRVPKTEGRKIVDLKIKHGWVIQDSNFLACSRKHIESVFEMLSGQPNKGRFVGGLEAARLTEWHCDLFKTQKPESIYFAYDTPGDKMPLEKAGIMLRRKCVPKSILYCYCLIGHKKDTIEKAEKRLRFIYDCGLLPFAMLYRSDEYVDNGSRSEWKDFQRLYTRPAITRKILRAVKHD